MRDREREQKEGEGKGNRDKGGEYEDLSTKKAYEEKDRQRWGKWNKR